MRDLTLPRLRRTSRLRWKIAALLDRSDRTCGAETRDWGANATVLPVRTLLDNAACKAEARDPRCQVCYCGKFMAPELRKAQDDLNARGANGVVDLTGTDDPWAEVPRG